MIGNKVITWAES